MSKDLTKAIKEKLKEELRRAAIKENKIELSEYSLLSYELEVKKDDRSILKLVSHSNGEKETLVHLEELDNAKAILTLALERLASIPTMVRFNAPPPQSQEAHSASRRSSGTGSQ